MSDSAHLSRVETFPAVQRPQQLGKKMGKELTPRQNTSMMSEGRRIVLYYIPLRLRRSNLKFECASHGRV